MHLLPRDDAASSPCTDDELAEEEGWIDARTSDDERTSDRPRQRRSA